jgi:hypothetical protein
MGNLAHLQSLFKNSREVIDLKVAPIIHTRTFNCDFNSEFRVRPDCFMDCDIKWARKYVLGATASIDTLQGERWLVVDNDKYRIAGVTGFLKNICQKCQLSDEEMEKSKKMFCDNKGRLVYAFIGVVIDKNSSKDIGRITYQYLWSLYLNLIFPMWEKSYPEIIKQGFNEETFEICSGHESFKPEKISNWEIYEANPSTDYDIFEYYLGNVGLFGFSFCSNITDFNTVKQSDFSIITTTQNIITRIKRGVSSKSENTQELATKNEMQNNPTMQEDIMGNSNSTKKKVQQYF